MGNTLFQSTELKMIANCHRLFILWLMIAFIVIKHQLTDAYMYCCSNRRSQNWAGLIIAVPAADENKYIRPLSLDCQSLRGILLHIYILHCRCTFPVSGKFTVFYLGKIKNNDRINIWRAVLHRIWPEKPTLSPNPSYSTRTAFF